MKFVSDEFWKKKKVPLLTKFNSIIDLAHLYCHITITLIRTHFVCTFSTH